MSGSEENETTSPDVVAEAIAATRRASELRDAAIAQLLAKRQEIDRDLRTLGYVAIEEGNGNGTGHIVPSSVAKAASAIQQAQKTRFKDLTLAQVGKILLTDHGTLHGKEIERLAKAGGFKGGTANFQNYLPVAFKRDGGFENIGGNNWKLKESSERES